MLWVQPKLFFTSTLIEAIASIKGNWVLGIGYWVLGGIKDGVLLSVAATRDFKSRVRGKCNAALFLGSCTLVVGLFKSPQSWARPVDHNTSVSRGNISLPV